MNEKAVSNFKVMKEIQPEKNVGGVLKFVLNSSIDNKTYEKATQKTVAQIVARQILNDELVREHLFGNMEQSEMAL